MNSTSDENLFHNLQLFFKPTPLINNHFRINDINKTTALFSTPYKIHIFLLTETYKIFLDKEKENKVTSFIEPDLFRYSSNKKKFNNLYRVLESLHKECEEEGHETFDEVARTNAKRILDFLSEEIPDFDYYIYSTEDREIAIDYTQSEGSGKGLLILCNSKGEMAYFKTYDGKNSSICLKSIDKFCKKLKEAFEQFEIKNVYITTNLKENKEDIKRALINFIRQSEISNETLHAS